MHPQGYTRRNGNIEKTTSINIGVRIAAPTEYEGDNPDAIVAVIMSSASNGWDNSTELGIEMSPVEAIQFARQILLTAEMAIEQNNIGD